MLRSDNSPGESAGNGRFRRALGDNLVSNPQASQGMNEQDFGLPASHPAVLTPKQELENAALSYFIKRYSLVTEHAAREKARSAAEFAVAVARHNLNNAIDFMGGTSALKCVKEGYDSEVHNLCVAIVCYKDNTEHPFVSYSENSALDLQILGNVFIVPSVSGQLYKDERFGCGGENQHHTEAKLLNFLLATPKQRVAAVEQMLDKKMNYEIRKAQRLLKPHLANARPPGEEFTRKDYDFGVSKTKEHFNNIRSHYMKQISRFEDLSRVAYLVLISEIDCCRPCMKHSVCEFKSRYTNIPLGVLQLGKVLGRLKPKAKKQVMVPTQLQHVKTAKWENRPVDTAQNNTRQKPAAEGGWA